MPRTETSRIFPQRCNELWAQSTRPGYLEILTDAHLLLGRYVVNETAGLVWQFCDGQHSVEDIVSAIAGECDGSAPPSEIIRRDVIACLKEFRREGLVTWRDKEPVDVLLVIPPCPSTYAPYVSQVPENSTPPLGLAYIAAVLRQHGYRVAIEDLHIKSGKPEDIISVCRRLEPQIVGITAATPSYPNAERVARFVKAWRSETVTVIGGAQATGLPEEAVCSGAFDFAAVGEGEFTMLDLAGALLHGSGDPKQVPGLAFRVPKGRGRSSIPVLAQRPGLPFLRADSEIVYSAARPRIRNLDQLPRPARDLLDLDAYFQKGAIISTRGCPIDCIFCSCSAIVGRTYRVHSIGYVLDEVEELIRTYGIRHFDFHDDTFNLDNKRVFELCEEVEKRGLDFEWGCFCRAAQLTPELAQAMVRAGCQVIQFGVESGNEAILQAIKKQTSLRQIEKAVQAASAAGVEQIVCGLMVGHAQDTRETVQQTIDFGLHLRRFGATRVTLAVLTPYPGTEVFKRADELGIRLLHTDWEHYMHSRVVMETRNLDRHTLRELYVGGLVQLLEAFGHTLPDPQLAIAEAVV
jgi:radical SAM superfamily enzyme YgiQ (UPF0313 family)